MNIVISKPPSGGTVAAIPSKSAAHRLLICAALSSVETLIRCRETSNDIDATARSFRSLGANISYNTGIFHVNPVARPVPVGRTLDVGESGSTLRFLLPVACALGADAAFEMGGRLPSRPLSPLYEELVSHGCVLSPQGSNPLRTGGRLQGGTFTLRGDVSSQYVSGLLFALPLLDGGGTIRLTGPIESKPYIDMTVAALRKFGVVVLQDGPDFLVRGPQQFTSPGDVTVEGDWSGAAFLFAAGALGANAVTVTDLDPDSLQGDRAVLDLLKRFGARVIKNSGSVTVSPGALHGIDFDAGDIPDLVPVLAAVAAVAEGRTVIRRAGRLRLKESDRLKTVTVTLRCLGADIAEKEDGLVIIGRPRLLGGTVDSFGDHRIAMTAAVASAACDGPVLIRSAEAVNKSYPGFFRDFAALGGVAEEER